MNLRVKKVDVQILLVIFLFLEPWWLTTVKIVDLFYNLGKLVVCCWVVLYLLKTKFMLSKLSCLFITYRIYICVISAYRGVFDIGYLSESLQYICFFVLLDYFILKYKIRILKLVVLIMCMLLVFNLITYTPSGIIFEADSGYYLLGIRTRIAELAVPAMGLVLYLVKQTKKHRILFIFCLYKCNFILYS